MVPFSRGATPFSVKAEKLPGSPKASASGTERKDLIPAMRGKTPADVVGEANAFKAFGNTPHHTVSFDTASSSVKPQKGVLKTRNLPPPLPFNVSKERAGSVPPPLSVQFASPSRRHTRAMSVPADNNNAIVRVL